MIFAPKQKNTRCNMLVLYDSSFARYIERRVPLNLQPRWILVGDSLMQVVHGHNSTLDAKLSDVLQHVEYVRKGLGTNSEIDLVGDMPIGTYHNEKDALANARRMRDAGANSVKIECPQKHLKAILDVVNCLNQHKIPVMGHIGYLPQTSRKPRVLGSTTKEASGLLSSATALENAGIGSIIIELVFAEVARLITKRIRVPTIAFAGSGPFCTDQGMNAYDIMSLSALSENTGIKWMPKLKEPGAAAINEWLMKVDMGEYPAIGQYHSLT